MIETNYPLSQFLFQYDFFSSIWHSNIAPDCKLERWIVDFDDELTFCQVSAFNSQKIRKHWSNKSPENRQCGKGDANATFSEFIDQICHEFAIL